MAATEYTVLLGKKITPDELEALTSGVAPHLVDILVKKGVIKSPEEAAIRELRPTDIGLSNDVWSESLSTANDWNRITPSSGKKVEEKAIAIIGVKGLNPDYKAVGIRITKGQGRDLETKFEGFFEDMYADTPPMKAFKKISIFEPEDYMNIYLYARKAGTDNLVILGIVAEPKSKLIS